MLLITDTTTTTGGLLLSLACSAAVGIVRGREAESGGDAEGRHNAPEQEGQPPAPLLHGDVREGGRGERHHAGRAPGPHRARRRHQRAEEAAAVWSVVSLVSRFFYMLVCSLSFVIHVALVGWLFMDDSGKG